MRIEELADGVKMYLGDCQDVLPMLAPVSAVITDPPYEKEAHTTGRRATHGGKLHNIPISFGAMDESTRGIVADWCAANCFGWALTFCQAEAVAAWRDAFEAAGAKYKRSMVWIKPDGVPQYNGQMPGMGYESITAAWCGSGHSRWNGGGRHGVFTHCKNSGGKHLHETQKPQGLMRELVHLFTNPGDMILDPFAGSGSTGVAAIKMGRNFTGIERESRYFDIACRRLSEALAQGDFFVQAPKAKQGTFL